MFLYRWFLSCFSFFFFFLVRLWRKNGGVLKVKCEYWIEESWRSKLGGLRSMKLGEQLAKEPSPRLGLHKIGRLERVWPWKFWLKVPFLSTEWLIRYCSSPTSFGFPCKLSIELACTCCRVDKLCCGRIYMNKLWSF